MKITLPSKDTDHYEIMNYKINFNIDLKSIKVDNDIFEDMQRYTLPILDKHLSKVFKLYGDVMRKDTKRLRFKYVIEKLDNPEKVIDDLNDKLKHIFNVASITYLKKGTDYMIIIWIGQKEN